MPSVWETVGAAIAKYVVPPIVDAITAEFEKHTPEIIKAVVAATMTVGTRLAGDQVDTITDLIPGSIDDAVVDPIVRQVLDWLTPFRKP